MEHKKDAGLSESQYKMVMNLTQFNELDTDTVDYVMGTVVFLALMLLTTRRMERSAHLALSPAQSDL